MNLDLQKLYFYLFEKLVILFKGVVYSVGLLYIVLLIGEFKYLSLEFVKQLLIDVVDKLVVYFIIKGIFEFCVVISCWVCICF